MAKKSKTEVITAENVRLGCDKSPKTTEYIAYFRVSTKMQGDSGYGLASQKEIVEKFVKSRNGALIEEFIEIDSGKRNSRPVLNEAIRVVKATKGSVLVISKLDRLSRSVFLISRLQETSVNFICADMPDATPLTINLLSSIAQWEVETISDRTKAGLLQAKKNGVKLGNPRINEIRGRATDAARIENARLATERAEEYRTVVTGFISQGVSTLTALADKLNQSRFYSPRGKPFTATTVRRLLLRLHLKLRL